MPKRTGRASSAEQRTDLHGANSQYAGRLEECDEERRYIDPRTLTGSGSTEAFNSGISSPAFGMTPYLVAPVPEESALPHYNPDYAGFPLDGGLSPFFCDNSVFDNPSDAHLPYSTENYFAYSLSGQQTAPAHVENA